MARREKPSASARAREGALCAGVDQRGTLPRRSTTCRASAEAAVWAAREGVGATRVLHYQCADAVREGALMIVLGAFELDPVPVHLQDAYSHLEHREGDFPVSERIGQYGFSLPLFQEMTEMQQDRVISALRDILGEGR